MLLNAGVGLFVAGRVSSVREGIQAAAATVDAGAAAQRLKMMADTSHAEAVA